MNILNKYTVKTLVKNKTRTLVTIIGIILSAAMITAVTTFISSLQNFMLEVVIAEKGSWHGAVYDVSSENISSLQEKEDVTEVVSLQNIGYALLTDSQNEYKPYLFVAGISENFTDMMPVNLTEGRMPQSEQEIILPKHLASNGGIKYNLGDVLQLDLGERVWEGESLNQKNAYYPATAPDPENPDAQTTEAERLEFRTAKTYTVVGFYERPGFESYSAPGYTALTIASQDSATTYDLYLKLETPKNIYQFMSDHFSDEVTTECHTGLLRYMGASNEDSFNAVLYSMGGILIVIIMFASISLIYNAFSISVSERTKQFGLISSIGATKRQLLYTVLFEALVLSAVGIPLGILSGIGGIGVTLKLTSNLTASFLRDIENVSLHLSVTAASVLIAAAVGLVTVLISAFIPARRAVKVSAIDAIRQNNDITVNAKKVRTSKLTYKLFGFSGMVASKNFKRNKKKYRATVISLFMSVVLFISASSFCAYMEKSVSSLITDKTYDISYAYTPDSADKMSVDTLRTLLQDIDGVSRSSYIVFQYQLLALGTDHFTEDYQAFCDKYYNGLPKDDKTGNTLTNVAIIFADNDTYNAYLEENNMDSSVYSDPEKPVAIAFNLAKIYERGEGRYHTMRFFKENPFSVDLMASEEGGDGYRLLNTISVGAFTETIFFGTENMYGDTIMLIYPYSAFSAVTGGVAEEAPCTLFFTAENHNAVYEKMCNVLEDNQMTTSRLYDQAAAGETNKALSLLVRIFSMGFIVLISLIAAANVFNTISTNINLRRREFAMLRSIGMTNRGFNKMMNFECLLYGFKGLLFGLPVSFLVTYLIYRSILNGWNVAFFVPWSSVIIAIASVFLVVFATMLYSMRKIKKENTIDELKNENL